ncbi:MAG TPA: methyltransferase domain-containing protein [Gaiella sp.]|nr:methyltransferase domain-containing protein [Gaiella sp.]
MTTSKPSPTAASGEDRQESLAFTETVVETVSAAGVELELERPADVEALIDEEAFGEEEFLPYWAEQWPSGVALAHHVAASELEGRTILELGCGLGLPSLVAARMGANVVATDWSADALALLERNAARNSLELTRLLADWRWHEAFAEIGSLDTVLGADLLYEERNVAPVSAVLYALGAPAAIADPGRRHAGAFLDAMRGYGWTVDTKADPRLPRGGIHRLEPAVRPS